MNSYDIRAARYRRSVDRRRAAVAQGAVRFAARLAYEPLAGGGNKQGDILEFEPFEPTDKLEIILRALAEAYADIEA